MLFYPGISASPSERTRAMPADGLVADPLSTTTHAITIDAPPERVWPWIAQLGAGRAGWYSWDFIDNGRRPSENLIIEQYQHVSPGDVLPAAPGVKDFFVVESVEPPRDLILTMPGAHGTAMSWEHLLEPIDQQRSRLTVRARVAKTWNEATPDAEDAGRRRAFLDHVFRMLGRSSGGLMLALGGLGHRVMEARHLRGIKRRAERGDAPPRVTLRALVGAGDRIIGLTLPFAAAGIVASMLWPAAFHTGLGLAGQVVGGALLAAGVPIWLVSVAQILVQVPKGKLITSGPFAIVMHPLYTSVALLVVPGLGLAFDSWLGPALGLVLYAASRLLAGAEEAELAARFPGDYARYRKRVLLPWL